MSTGVALPWRGTTPPLTVMSAMAAALGAAVGLALAAGGPDETRPRAAAEEPRIGLASGAARLPLPPGWEPLRRRSTLPGLEQATAVRGVHAEAALDVRPPEDPSLLPADVVAAAGDLPAPTTGHVALRYDLGELRPGARVVAFAVPSTGGVVTIACAGPSSALQRTSAECERAVQALQLRGARFLEPTREAAAAIVLPDVFAQLNRQRRHERRRLAATRSPSRRHAAAGRLARAYATAAARIEPVAAGDAARLSTTLGELAREHRALAAASRRRDAGAAARAGAAIEQGERRVARLLAAITEPRAARAAPDRAR